jgi:hypothetical protein
MNYITIDIEGKKIGLKFGMASFRYLQNRFKDEVSFNGSTLTEIGFAQILYSGYYNNCIIKDVVPEYNFEFFVDFIENNLKNDEIIAQINSVIELWSQNDFVKNAANNQNQEAKKKNIRGKK